MRKILFVSNVAKKVGSFSIASIEAAKECGMEFHMAANWSEAGEEQIRDDEKKYNVKIHNISLARSPYSLNNIKAYKELVAIIQREGIDYIHCNTPVGGLLGRLAGKKCGIKKIIYQVHGFHFYKGASMINWFLFFPIEKWLANYTDVLVTINTEDYEIATSKMRFRKNGKVYYVHGVGIDTSVFKKDLEIRNKKRKELGLKEHEFAFVTVGRLEKNKNIAKVIKSLSLLNNKHLKLLICGNGSERNNLEKLCSELGLTRNVFFLGNRTDMAEIYNAVDALIMLSYREGLSRTIMESMASGLPCIVSRIRGNVDLIEDGKGGFCVSAKNEKEIADKIEELIDSKEIQEKMSIENIKKIEEFDVKEVIKEIREIYSIELGREIRD